MEKKKIYFYVKEFISLSIYELHAIFKLREEVFIREQKCTAVDIDGKDIEAIHVLGFIKKDLVSYARIFVPSVDKKYLNFGRVCVAKKYRGQKFGREIIVAILDYAKKYYPDKDIKISSQLYLKDFYAGFGFQGYGNVYDDGGIEHIGMIKEVKYAA